MTKEIPLTHGKVALVDDEDFEYLIRVTWYACHNKNTWYAQSHIDQTTAMMHRIITRAEQGQVVDHINKDGLDNRKENLRLCSVAENNRNRRINKVSQTGYKGVKPTRTLGSYVAVIKHNSKRIYLGTFHTAEEAARAYDEAAKKLHGVFASLNFP